MEIEKFEFDNNENNYHQYYSIDYFNEYLKDDNSSNVNNMILTYIPESEKYIITGDYRYETPGYLYGTYEYKGSCNLTADHGWYVTSIVNDTVWSGCKAYNGMYHLIKTFKESYSKEKTMNIIVYTKS